MNKRTLEVLSGFFLFSSGAWVAHSKTMGVRPWDEYGDIGRIFSVPYEYTISIYFLLFIISAILKTCSLLLGAKNCQAHIKKLLDGIVSEVMRTPDTYNEQNYRITLYKFKLFSAPAFFSQNLRNWKNIHWFGWLIPYVRSGDQPLSNKTFFKAPQTSLQGQKSGHGICGTAWILGECKADGLPRITGTSGEAQRRKYCDRTFIDEAELTSRLSAGRSLAQSFLAERLSTKHKKRWGVLIYDSVDTAPVVDNTNETGHRLGLQALSIVLEEHTA